MCSLRFANYIVRLFRFQCITKMEARVVNTIRSKHGRTRTLQQLISTLETQINNELHINIQTVYCSLIQKTHTHTVDSKPD